MNNFESFGLSQKMNNALVDMKFTTPTPIQQKAIPIVLNGFDILGSAQTGTGKTAAFCIPIIEMLAKDEKSMALIMMPTRELARQVIDVVNQLTNNGDKIKSACLIFAESGSCKFILSKMDSSNRLPRKTALSFLILLSAIITNKVVPLSLKLFTEPDSIISAASITKNG